MTAHAKTIRNARAAALHQQGDQWRLLVLTREGGATRVESAQSFSTSETSAITAALERAGDPPLVRIIPGAGAITRVVKLPDSNADDLTDALALMAEAQLPSVIPAHRRAAGVIASPTNNGALSAMLLGWPDSQTPEPLRADERYTTETAALSALLAPDSGAAAYIDTKLGSIAIFSARDHNALARTLREDPNDPSRWSAALSAAADTAGSDPVTPPSESAILIDEKTATHATSKISGARADKQWLDHYAIALGAALGAISDKANLTPLYRLAPRAESSSESRITILRRRLAEPATATAVIIAALAILLLAPLASAVLRHQILVAKTGGLEQQRESEQQTDRQLALYSELEQRTWPMSRVLASLSGLIPQGIALESVQIIEGEELTLAGTADSADALNEMQQAIAQSGVFTDPTLPRIERSATASAGPVAFDLAARVIRPFADPRGGEDYREQTLAVRMYGEEAVARYPDDITNLVSPERAPSTTAESRTLATAGSTNADGDDTGTPRERARANDRETQTIPEPLTDADIDAMSRTDLIKELGSRRKASSYPELDPEDEQRLKDELDKIRAKLRESRGG